MKKFPGNLQGGGFYFYKIAGFQPPSWGGAVMSRRVSLLYFSDALVLPLLDHPDSARTQMSPSYSNI